jgi:hypothetical protein
MIAGIYRITCDQGATFERTLTVYNPSISGASATPVNLTGYSARMQVRPETDSATVLVELTTENGRLALGGAAGTIDMEIEAEVTATIDRDGVYDLEIYNNAGKVYRVIKGRFVLEPEVTRDEP